jgi:hypothetical protein
VHRYIKYNLKKKKKERRPEPQARSARHTTLRRWVLPVRSWLGSTLAVGFYPFVLGSYPSSLGLTLRRWALPFVVGPYPSSLGLTLRRWSLPFVIGPYHSSLGLRRCILRPSQLGLPLRFGFTLRCWVLPPEGSGCDHLRVARHEGSGCDHLRVVRHEGGGCERRQVRKAAGAKGGGFEHPRVVQHEGGFVLVGAKAAVRLVGLGVIVVVS